MIDWSAGPNSARYNTYTTAAANSNIFSFSDAYTGWVPHPGPPPSLCSNCANGGGTDKYAHRAVKHMDMHMQELAVQLGIDADVLNLLSSALFRAHLIVDPGFAIRMNKRGDPW